MLARGADLATLDDAQALVKHATRDGIVPLMRFVRDNLDNRPPKDFLGRHDAKLNAYNRHCILISLSRNIFGDPFLPNISVLSTTAHMAGLLKVRLTEDQIQAYRQPANTQDPECGGGINCIFCGLKMLGIYDEHYADNGFMCMPRLRSGRAIANDEHLKFIEEAIEKKEHKGLKLKFDYKLGDPTETLEKLSHELPPGHALFLIYGRNRTGTHAVVLRKAGNGAMELIDPQQGRQVIRFSQEQIARFGLEVTENYYRVGTRMIPDVIIEQSVLFRYWPSREALLNDLGNFVIGTLTIEGEKMQVEDFLHGERMEVEDVYSRVGEKRLGVSQIPFTIEAPPQKRKPTTGGDISVSIKRGPTKGGFVLPLRYGKGRMTISVKRRSLKRKAGVPRK